MKMKEKLVLHHIFGHLLVFLDLTEPVSSFSQSVAQEKETFNSQFDREGKIGNLVQFSQN